MVQNRTWGLNRWVGRLGVAATTAAIVAAGLAPTSVLASDATSVLITTSSQSAIYGSTASFNVQVTDSGVPATIPAGSVQLVADGFDVGAPVILDASGAASIPDSALGVAGSPHVITANYIPSGDFAPNTGTLPGGQSITAAQLTANVTGSQIYGSSVPVFTPSITGFVNGDTLSVVTGTLACLTDATSSSPAGSSHPISDCSGLSAGNYTIGYTTGSLTVNQAPLQITASSGAITYGSSAPAITPSYAGFVNGDMPASLTTPPICSTTVSGTPPAGTYITSCSGAGDPNYTIGYTTGSLTVNQAPLQITASSATITIGSTVPAITPSYSGFVNGDTAASLTIAPTCSTSATSSSSAATYTTSCSGALDANYQITYQPASLFVVPLNALPVLTITPDPQTRAFGTANPTFTFVISGFINNQTLKTALVTGAPLCTTSATLFSVARTYPITCTVGTLTSPFYSFTFVPGTLTITRGASSTSLSTTTTVFETSTPVTWTAAVEPGVSGATPAGSLVFTIDGVARPVVPLDANGRGSITVTWPTAGRKSVSVAYSGDASYAASGTASASPTVVANTARASGVGLSATTIYPIVDGWLDTVTARGTRLEPLPVFISVKNAAGIAVRTFKIATASGPYTWAWNGRDLSGSFVPAGVYTIVQTLTDPYGSRPRRVVTSKVTLSLRNVSWSTVTVTAKPGPRCFQFTSGDGVGAYTCSSAGGLALSGSAGHWPGVGYQFTLPTGVGYRSIRVELLGKFTGSRPAVGLHVWSLGSTWGQLYRPGWGRTAISPTARAWSGVTFTNPGAYISGRSVRVYVDGGGRLGGAFGFSITGIRLVVSVGTLQ